MKDDNQEKIINNVLSEISSGKVKMHSKSYFAFLTVFSSISVVLAGLSVGYVINLLGLWYKIETSDAMMWGARYNLGRLVANFPFWTLPLAILGITFSVYMIRKLGKLYKIRTGYVVIAMILVSVVFGLIFSGLGVGRGGRGGENIFGHRNNPGSIRIMK